jgi:hypothetical protein
MRPDDSRQLRIGAGQFITAGMKVGMRKRIQDKSDLS